MCTGHICIFDSLDCTLYIGLFGFLLDGEFFDAIKDGCKTSVKYTVVLNMHCGQRYMGEKLHGWVVEQMSSQMLTFLLGCPAVVHSATACCVPLMSFLTVFSLGSKASVTPC